MKTQKEKVLAYLIKHKSITSWTAIQKFSITRLASVIFDLKNDGHEIFTEIVKTDDARWAKYVLIKVKKHD
jgi:predicted methyltransferase